MRDPARKALYASLAALAAAGAIGFGAEREQRVGEHWTFYVPIILGLAVAPFALVTLIQALFAVRGRARLLRGEGVIARWHVYPGEWEQFRRLDCRRSGERASLINDLWVRKAAPREPVEVIVGEKSLLIDGSYHGLSPRGLPELRGISWLDGPPLCLEFSLLYPRSRYGGTVPTTLRIPVPAGSRGTALRVVAHFEPRLRRTPGLALRNPPKTYRVCAAIVAGAALLALGGYGLSRAFPDGNVPMSQLLLLTLLIVCAILGVFGAILALATFLLSRR